MSVYEPTTRTRLKEMKKGIWKEVEKQGFLYTRQGAMIAAQEKDVPVDRARVALSQACWRGTVKHRFPTGVSFIHIDIDSFKAWLASYSPVEKEADSE